jgi:hypothetical protein
VPSTVLHGYQERAQPAGRDRQEDVVHRRVVDMSDMLDPVDGVSDQGEVAVGSDLAVASTAAPGVKAQVLAVPSADQLNRLRETVPDAHGIRHGGQSQRVDGLARSGRRGCC